MRRYAAKHGATVAIIGLLLLNVVLIVPLFMGRHDVPDPADAAPSPVASNSLTANSPSPTRNENRTSAQPKLTGDRPRRLLATNSDQIAWRAKPTGCGEVGEVEVTTNGGKTWRPADLGLESVVRLRAFGDRSVFVIGADQDCQPVYSVSAYPGAKWQSDNSMLADTWFRLPRDLNTVHDPHDRTSKPCGDNDLADLAGRGDDEAIALCADGSIRVRNGGTDWKEALHKSGVVAVSADDNRFVMAFRSATCDGLTVQRFTLRRHLLNAKKKERCMGGVSTDPGVVAVSNRGRSIWLWSGDLVRRKS
jgi:hypothetical protein